jgi:hypothetical protein
MEVFDWSQLPQEPLAPQVCDALPVLVVINNAAQGCDTVQCDRDASIHRTTCPAEAIVDIASAQLPQTHTYVVSMAFFSEDCSGNAAYIDATLADGEV